MTDKVSKRFSKKAVRIVNLLIVSCLLLAPAGCAGKTEEPEEDASFMKQYEETPGEAIEAPAAAERTTIRFLFPGYQPKNWENVKAEIEKRIRDTLNVTLDFKWKETTIYLNEIKTLQASNQDYDAFILAGPDVNIPDFTKLARDGVLKDITNIFPQSAPALFKKYTNAELAYATVDDKLYAVPSLFTVAECPEIFASDTLLKKYKFDDITNFEQYEAFLKTVKDNDPNAIPGVNANTFISTLPGVFGYACADKRNMLVYNWDDPKMQLLAWEKTPEFYDTVNMFIKWYKDEYLKSVKNASDYFSSASILVGGALAPPSDKTEKMSLSTANGTVKETDPLRIFRLYPEKPVQRGNPIGSFNGNGSFMFPESSNNTAMVLRFLEWVQLDRENYYLMMYGIEGEDYVLKDGKPEKPEGMGSITSSFMYWDGQWAFRNTEYKSSEQEAQQLLEYQENNSKYPPHGVFYPDYGTLEQISEKRSRGIQEFLNMLMQGQIKTQEQLDNFIKRMDELGTDELISEAQSQLTKE